MVQEVGPRVRVDLPDIPLVHRRADQPRLQRARSPRRQRPRRAHGADLLQRARRATVFHIRRTARTRDAHGGGAARARPPQRRSADDLHADVARGDRPDARHGPHRRDPLGRLRRLRCARARRTHSGQRLAARVHGQRHLSQGQGIRPQVDRERSTRPGPPRRRACHRAAAWHARRLRSMHGARHDVGRVSRARQRPVWRTRSRWNRTRRRSSSRRRARRLGPSWPFTRTAATRSISSAWAAGASA